MNDPSDIRTRIGRYDLAILDRMAKGHMVPVIEYGDAWECETTRGDTFTVPASVETIPDRVGCNGEPGEDETVFLAEQEGDGPRLRPDIGRRLLQYMPEGISGGLASVTISRNVYLCRMSAPGYMDCTDWESHESAQAAADSLIANYSDEGEG